MKVLLLAGGDSSERNVSLASGKAVNEALIRLGHKVYAIDPSSGKSLTNSDGSFIEAKTSEAQGKTPIVTKGSSWSLANTLASPGFMDIDIVVITLHGGSGENGMIQCLMELAGKKYTGSNMTASAIAMDKAVTKRLCAAESIPTPQWALYRMCDDKVDGSCVEDIRRRFQMPVIIKPNDGGSTIGLSKVDDDRDIEPAIVRAMEESRNVLVEKFIPGREITAAVLDGKELPLVEIRPKNGLYDYESKYTKGRSEYIVPAEIDDAVASAIKQAAVRIYEAIGASGLARADFILDNENKFYFLELNTLPGMTELSLAPMAARTAGIDFDGLVTQLIESAMKR